MQDVIKMHAQMIKRHPYRHDSKVIKPLPVNERQLGGAAAAIGWRQRRSPDKSLRYSHLVLGRRQVQDVIKQHPNRYDSKVVKPPLRSR